MRECFISGKEGERGEKEREGEEGKEELTSLHDFPFILKTIS